MDGTHLPQISIENIVDVAMFDATALYRTLPRSVTYHAERLVTIAQISWLTECDVRSAVLAQRWGFASNSVYSGRPALWFVECQSDKLHRLVVVLGPHITPQPIAGCGFSLLSPDQCRGASMFRARAYAIPRPRLPSIDMLCAAYAWSVENNASDSTRRQLSWLMQCLLPAVGSAAHALPGSAAQARYWGLNAQ